MSDFPDDSVTIGVFQQRIRQAFHTKDAARGVEGTFLWFMEEVGELATALRSRRDEQNLREEFADVLAWMCSLANLAGVDLESAVREKYGLGCPQCRQAVCTCDVAEKP